MRHTIRGGAEVLGESLPRFPEALAGLVCGETSFLDSSAFWFRPGEGTMRAFPSPGLEAKGSS